jgi:hypothetical protein
LLAWLTINAHVIALGALFGVYHSAAFKLAIGAVDLFGFSAMLIFYLGRLREWDRLASHLSVLARQRRLRETETAFAKSTKPDRGRSARRAA